MVKHKEVFGELPPPSKGQTLIQMDLKLKKEYENSTIRGKCWGMPKVDQDEIESQATAMLNAGLAEEFLGKDFPRFCSPTLLVEKEKGKENKTTTSKRMCIDYRKLNQRTQIHVGQLPKLEEAVEALCHFRYKCKLDMRSGFWQVALSEEAKNLCAFITPSGRIFRPTVMPFGLTNAPPIFQELMEKIISQTKHREEVKHLFHKTNGHLAAFFDDSCIGAQNKEDLLLLLDIWLDTCKKNNLRVKLTKCEFLKEDMEYLGFEVGYQNWKPSSKKVEALQKAKISNLKTLQSFLGACNFYRRHVPNFTYSSAILTDLTRKNRKWEWTPHHEHAFQELKHKLANVKGLGIPNPEGEIVLVTDASNVGGGASIYQWQKKSPPHDPHDVNKNFEDPCTQGVNKDGTLKHTHGGSEFLVPLGHYNWKWNPTRGNYSTYQQELLAGILTLASQIRILGHLPIVWLCDQEATMTFAKGPPP